MSSLYRRLLTLPLLFSTTTAITALLPLWLPLACLAAGLIPAVRAGHRALFFITIFLWCETLGVLTSFAIWLRYGYRSGAKAQQQWLNAHYTLQNTWILALKRSAERLFRLTFIVEGEEALEGDGVIMLLRHCSIGDTLIPVVFYNLPYRRRLRFVLKRELLFDPCLDIVGSRLPNYFVDRSSWNTTQEIQGIQAMLHDLPQDCGLLIYPEGTRFSQEKRASILTRLRAQGDTEALVRAERWDNLLPLRLGGILGLLATNPGRDLVFCAHTGFEGSADLTHLYNGAWLDTIVRLRFWRIPFAEIPTNFEEQRTFLYAAWDRMNHEVVSLKARGG